MYYEFMILNSYSFSQKKKNSYSSFIVLLGLQHFNPIHNIGDDFSNI